MILNILKKKDLKICNDFNKTLFLYLFLLFNQKEIENLASGSVQQNLSKDLI